MGGVGGGVMQGDGGELFLPGPPLPPVGAQGRQSGGAVTAVEPEPGQGAAHGIDTVGQRQGRRDVEADAQTGGALPTALARAQFPTPADLRGPGAAAEPSLAAAGGFEEGLRPAMEAGQAALVFTSASGVGGT